MYIIQLPDLRPLYIFVPIRLDKYIQWKLSILKVHLKLKFFRTISSIS